MSEIKPKFYNSSDLIRDFYSVSDFEITFLPPLSFWIEKTTKHQILQNHWFQENRLRCNFESSKTILCDNLHRKNETVGISLISWKSIFRERLFWRRNKNNSRIKTSNASYISFQFPDNCPVSNREIKKKLKTSPTSGQFFGTRQKLNRDFYSVSEYDTTILSPVSFWMEVFTFQTLKQNSFHKENLFEKEHIFYQNFRDKIWYWNKLSQRFRKRIKNFETCHVLKLKTSNAWKFEGKTFSWNQCLRENLLLKKHFLHNFTL